MRIIFALALSSLVSLGVQARQGLLLFLIDKNNVGLEKYSLDELSGLTKVTNKVSSQHCKQILKIGDKKSNLEDIGWHEGHPDVLMINVKDTEQRPLCLHLKELFSDKTALSTMKFVPGALYLLDDSHAQETDSKTHLVLQLSDVDPLLTDRELLFERAIVGGCVFLVDDVDQIVMARAQKTVTKQELDTYLIVSPHTDEANEPEHAPADQEAPSTLNEVAPDAQENTPVVVDQDTAHESQQAVTTPIENEVTPVVAPVKPLKVSWYRYVQVKFAAVLKYLNRLIFR